jgi:ABC-2 type transport system ATP-binding protein
VTATALAPGVLEIDGLSAEQVGELAAKNGYVLHELVQQQVTLEEAFMDLTQGELEFRAHAELETEEVAA